MLGRVGATIIAVGRQYCITYSECAFVALDNLREMRMCCIVAVGLYNISPTLSKKKNYDFRGKMSSNVNCVFCFSL